MFANLLYACALTLVSPIVLYRMIRHGRYRRGVGEKLWGLSKTVARKLRDGHDDCVWFHAVSVGEVNLLPRLVGEFQKLNPNTRVVISSSTDTGYDLAVKRFGADRVFFCPLDFSWAVKRTLRNLRATQLVLSELELWPNLIKTASRRGCAVKVANARLSDRSCAGYQRFGFLTQRIFESLDWVGAQDEHASANFAVCGTPETNIQITGSLKFDDAPSTRDSVDVQNLHDWSGIDPWHRVWCVGSTQPGEEAMALRIYDRLRRFHPNLRLILVPRHQERFDQVAHLVTQNGLDVHRRSVDDSLLKSTWESDTVILVDTIGELRSWWGVCQFATVGGSFGDRGGQNMLEPAGYGAAVSFGPDTRNFRWIADALIDQDAAVRVADEQELEAFVSRCLDNPLDAECLGRSAKQLIQQRRGATSKTIAAIDVEGLEAEQVVCHGDPIVKAA